MKKLVFFLTTVITLGLSHQAIAQKTIVDVAVGNEDFSTLVAALNAADLVGALQGEGPFTVFAPTNAAFAKIDSKTLNSLLTIAGKSEQTVSGGPVMQRVVWLFRYSEAHNYCHIVPRLQKMSKKGSWTKGRPMALKSLYHEFRTMEGLTDQDRQVCQAIKEEYYRTDWRNNKREYTLDENMALPALVAHPLLFLEDSPGVRVEFVLSEPEMRIKDENNKPIGRKLISRDLVGPFNGISNIVIQSNATTPSKADITRFGSCWS